MIQEKFVAVVEMFGIYNKPMYIGLIQETVDDGNDFLISFPADSSLSHYAGKDILISCISTTADASILADKENVTIQSRGEKEVCGKKELEEVLDIGNYLHFWVRGDEQTFLLFATGWCRVVELYKLIQFNKK